MKDWKYHCSVLGVREDAPLKDVRRAYRRLALERHPDKHENSQKSKEDFQQLNESYRYVAAGLIGGKKPEQHAPPPPGQGGFYRNATTQTPPVAQQNPFPNGRPPRVPQKPNFKKVWIHAAIACVVLLTISFFLDRPAERAPAGKGENRDLFIKSWCLISHQHEGRDSSDVNEWWSQRVCEDRCSSLGKLYDVSCTWSGNNFRAYRGSSPAPAPIAATGAPMPAVIAPIPPTTLATIVGVDDTVPSCEIDFDNSNGSANSKYKGVTEGNCKALCNGMMDQKPREGIRCSWKGAEFRRQVPPKPVASASDPEDDAILEAQPALGPKLISRRDDVSFRTTCYMSVVNEDGAHAQEFENVTSPECEQFCINEINSHPSGREVRCAHNGRSLITWVPDPMVSYLARKPSSNGTPGTTGIQVGNDFIANCEVRWRWGSKEMPPKLEANTDIGCKKTCDIAKRHMSRNTRYVCLFNGESFDNGTIP